MAEISATGVMSLVDEAVLLDMEIKSKSKKLDRIKAELQAEALREIDNKNVKYIEFFGSLGSSQVGYKEKFEITNFRKLCSLIGENIEDNVKREEVIKITPNAGLKAALIAVYRGECEPCDLNSLLFGMGLDDKQIKTALKKLKGDYWKDRATLESFGCSGDMEEELDAIRRHKNYEAATKYINVDNISEEEWKAFKTTISLEETLSIGLNYETDL
ncbi:MAG: hypothetical protein ACI4LO_00225 [Anaerovoracaceae bacterium]